MSKKAMLSRTVLSSIFVCGTTVYADVVIDTVTVANPGNAPDTRYATPGYGAVDYVYDIAMFEATAGQYTTFLNAVATTDTYALYDLRMADIPSYLGCNIQRTGSSGSYTYSVAADWANRPVNYVSFWDALRFANWLHNGQPNAPQGPASTEDGAYTLDGYTGNDGSWITRNPGATWVIPTENEWYKAAYYDSDAAVYYDYPTGTDTRPDNRFLWSDTANSANFAKPPFDLHRYTIGAPYWRTEVGQFALSSSPYRTFDQGGNVWEFNETVSSASDRGFRGGSFHSYVTSLRSVSRFFAPFPSPGAFGFRVAYVPEPATLGLLGFGAMLLARRRSPTRR